MNFGEVSNLWLRRGSESPLLVFAGHTDVVPPGPETRWELASVLSRSSVTVACTGVVQADMKSSIAAMTVACENFIRAHPGHAGSIAFLLTSDEEGPAVDGTVKVIEQLQARNEVHRLVPRGRTQQPENRRRHHENRTARFTVGDRGCDGHPGPCRLPADCQKSHSRMRTGAGRAGVDPLGFGQCALPSHLPAGIQHAMQAQERTT